MDGPCLNREHPALLSIFTAAFFDEGWIPKIFLIQSAFSCLVILHFFVVKMDQINNFLIFCVFRIKILFIYRIYPNIFSTFIRDFYGFLCNFPMGCFEIPWFWLPDTRTGWKATWSRRAPASVQASLGECLHRTEKVRGWIRIYSLFNSILLAGWWFGT